VKGSSGALCSCFFEGYVEVQRMVKEVSKDLKLKTLRHFQGRRWFDWSLNLHCCSACWMLIDFVDFLSRYQTALATNEDQGRLLDA